MGLRQSSAPISLTAYACSSPPSRPTRAHRQNAALATNPWPDCDDTGHRLRHYLRGLNFTGATRERLVGPSSPSTGTTGSRGRFVGKTGPASVFATPATVLPAPATVLPAPATVLPAPATVLPAPATVLPTPNWDDFSPLFLHLSMGTGSR